MEDRDRVEKEQEIRRLYAFVAEQVIAGLYKADIIDKLLELGVDRATAAELVADMEQRLRALRSKRILLVMGDDRQGASLARQLRAAGYQTATAAGVDAALDEVRRLLPHLVIMEHDLAELNGQVFLRRLRRGPIGRKVPVFVLCARPGMKESFTVFRLVEFIAAPYTDQQIIRRVKTILLLPDRHWL